MADEYFNINKDFDFDQPEDITITVNLNQIEAKKPQNYVVLVYNDDYTPIDFVIEVLKTIFQKSDEEASIIVQNIHENGGPKAIDIFPKDIAETKADQVLRIAEANEYPLFAEARPESEV